MTGPRPLDGQRDWSDLRGVLADQVPLLRRLVDLDRAGLARIRVDAQTVAVFVRLPFDVLVARTVPLPPADPPAGPGRTVLDRTVLDRTVPARELLAWLTDEGSAEPAARDSDWRGGLPPSAGWQRVETVPDAVVRDLVRKGALALQDAAAREGVPGAQPRAEVADALLDSIVLTVTSDRPGGGPEPQAEVTLRSLSALTRMGFLGRDCYAHVDVSGRWTRIVGTYGSVFAERAGLGLLSL